MKSLTVGALRKSLEGLDDAMDVVLRVFVDEDQVRVTDTGAQSVGVAISVETAPNRDGILDLVIEGDGNGESSRHKSSLCDECQEKAH